MCVSKFKESGVEAALFDAKRPKRTVEISDDAISLFTFLCIIYREIRIESFLGKMTRQILRGIRVKSKQEPI